jgi:hypothetical protein
MPSDLLIDRLVNDLKPVRRRTTRGDALILGVLAAIELALFLGLGAARPDMSTAMELPSFWWNLASLGLISLVSGTVAVLSFDPVESPRRGLRWLGAIAVLCWALGWVINTSGDGLNTLAARLEWHDGLQCVCRIVLLSLPAVIGFGLLMRRGAPTDTAATAFVSGVAAAAWGAFVFVFACPYDDPLYVTVWYGLGCGLVTMFARLVLPPLTRW